MKDYYKILEIEETAKPEEIKASYRKLALKYHPDRNPNDAKAEAKFKEINEAHDTLRDEDKRSQYDYTRKNGDPTNIHFGAGFGPGFGAGFGSVNDIFRDFETMFSHRPQNRVPKNKDINVNYGISLEEAYSGKEAEISFTMPDGTSKNFKTKIPAGIESGMRIRHPNVGDQSRKDLPAGDIYITVSIVNHLIYRRNGQNLVAPLNVSVFDAILGAGIDFQTIDGSHIKVNIKPGTEHGLILRIPGKGMTVRDTNARGDLFLEVQIKIPKNLSERVLNLLREAKVESKN